MILAIKINAIMCKSRSSSEFGNLKTVVQLPSKFFFFLKNVFAQKPKKVIILNGKKIVQSIRNWEEG